VAILALDGVYGEQTMLGTIATVMNGPMGPHMAWVKLNDGLHDRDGGPNVVDAILDRYDGIGVFGDIKGADVWGTINNICKRYGDAVARMLMTISIHVDHGVFVELGTNYPNLKVAAMVVPTDIGGAVFERRYGVIPSEAMRVWYGELVALYREELGIPDGYPSELVIASADMLPTVREHFPGLLPVTPGVRDIWMVDPDRQKRTTGVRQALEAGARYVVMGAQLLKGATGVDARESQARTAAEIEAYFEAVKAIPPAG
jgi:orotidine-5'-phosphate decarboxylase